LNEEESTTAASPELAPARRPPESMAALSAPLFPSGSLVPLESGEQANASGEAAAPPDPQPRRTPSGFVTPSPSTASATPSSVLRSHQVVIFASVDAVAPRSNLTSVPSPANHGQGGDQPRSELPQGAVERHTRVRWDSVEPLPSPAVQPVPRPGVVGALEPSQLTTVPSLPVRDHRSDASTPPVPSPCGPLRGIDLGGELGAQ
jgi:hypothetical protein